MGGGDNCSIDYLRHRSWRFAKLNFFASATLDRAPIGKGRCDSMPSNNFAAMSVIGDIKVFLCRDNQNLFVDEGSVLYRQRTVRFLNSEAVSAEFLWSRESRLSIPTVYALD
jgi:hypothetical protein